MPRGDPHSGEEYPWCKYRYHVSGIYKVSISNLLNQKTRERNYTNKLAANEDEQLNEVNIDNE